MALARSMGWVALNQWRASSPTRTPDGPRKASPTLGHLPVRPGPAVRTEVFIQGVLDEGVGEVVAPRVRSSRTRATAAAASRMSSNSSSEVFVARAKQVEVEVPTDHRRHRQHPLSVLTEAHQPEPRSLRARCRVRPSAPGIPRPCPSPRGPGRWLRSPTSGAAPRSRRTGCHRSRDTRRGRGQPRRRRGCDRRRPPRTPSPPLSSSPASSMRETPLCRRREARVSSKGWDCDNSLSR
jgi:hypothetical protein